MQRELDIQKRWSALSAEKRALLEKRLNGEKIQQKAIRQIMPRPKTSREIAPLSFSQLRYWFFDQFEPGTYYYNNFACVRLSGKLHLHAFREVWNTIVQRHEILRTTFMMQDDQPVQVIAPHIPFQLPLIDLTAWPEESKEREVEQRVLAEAQQPFDLTRGPLMRITLYKLSEGEHRLMITIHHIIADGWSIEVLLQELGQLYYSFSYSVPISLQPLSIQYADFALWQNAWLQGPALEAQLTYWKKTLADIPDQLLLPFDHPRPTVQTFRGAALSFEVPPPLTSALKALCNRESVTPFMAILALLQTLLARYSGQRDIVIGSPTANRTLPELEPLIGCFINMFVLRTDLSGNPTFQELLRRVRSVALGAYAHQDIPFEKLVEEIRPERSLSHSPLFQVMFAYQSFLRTPLALPELTITSLKMDAGASMFDIDLTLWDIDGALQGDLVYSTTLFERATIVRFQTHFLQLLESAVADATQRIFNIPLLTPAEQELQADWNNTGALFCSKQTLHEIFEAQVTQTPEVIALVSGETRLSYRELNQRANQLAHYLSTFLLTPGEPVGLYLERSPDLIIGLLAILKAGGAYLPLDITAPPERIAWMIEDASPSFILTHSSLRTMLPASFPSTLCLDTLYLALAQESDQNLPENMLLSQGTTPAYGIYTSGSTGHPKGVLVPHRAVVNYVTSFAQRYDIHAQDRVLQFAAISFDTAAEEIFLALCHGASLVLRPAGYAPSLQELLALVNREQISVLDLPTAYWHEWVTALPQSANELPASLRLIIIGGEAASPSHLTRWQDCVGERIRLINTYGPTETAIVTTTADLTRYAVNDAQSLPIGHPIANVRTYVLDSALQQLPIGISGELYIAGAGVAWGYLNNSDSTAAKFLPDPFSQEPGSRLYRTGDLVRYLPDGNLVFLERLDQQIKIRGYRVEPGEIENVLLQHPTVQNAAVLVHTSTPQAPDDTPIVSLLAYVVPAADQSLDLGELEAFLHTLLPSYMVPSAYIPLARLPLTSHGKVDRSALPKPVFSLPAEEHHGSTQQTSTEEILAVIWSQMLERPEVGNHENFFEIGGHSLLAMRLIARISTTFRLDLPLRALFENPTIAELGAVIQNAAYLQKRSGLPPIVPVSRDLPIPLSSQQQRFWFLASLSNGQFADPLAIFLKLYGTLNIPALEQSLNIIMQRHESLRTTFSRIQRQLVQRIAPFKQTPLPLYDLSTLAEPERSNSLHHFINEQAKLPFDLEQGPLFRSGLVRLASDEHVLWLCMHHIIIDGWSCTILRQELFTLYQSFSQGTSCTLPPPSLQYADFAAWQAAWLQSDDFAQQRSYWAQQLAELPAALDLPTDYPRPVRQTFHGSQLSLLLPPSLLTSLTSYARSQSTTLFMLLLAAFDTLLWGYTGQEDIAVGTIIANRNHPQTEQVVGLFTNSLVLRCDLSGNPTFQEHLQRVRSVTLDAYEHQDMPFEKLVEVLKPRRDPSRSPLFQVLMLLQNLPVLEALPDGIAIEPLNITGSTATYDLTLYFTETRQGLLAVLEYNTDLFAQQTIQRLLNHLNRLLEQISVSPEASLTSLILSLAESTPPS